MTDQQRADAATQPHTAAAGVLLVTGMSGAGRSSALKVLEDLGFEAVDNLPLRLIGALAAQGPEPGRGLAFGIDIRSRDFTVAGLTGEIARLRRQTGHGLHVLFVDCDEEVLRRRYTETRRKHPLASDRPLTDGIARERRLLAPLREAADTVIDTSRTNIHEFARILRGHFGPSAAERANVFITSFSFRAGLPRDADLVFDTRFLKNPHYDPALRPMSGMDAAVGRYVESDADFAAYFEAIMALLALTLPRFDGEGKSYLTIAVGCTGGRHRSVYLAEQLGRRLSADGRRVHVTHRDLDLDGGADIDQERDAEDRS